MAATAASAVAARAGEPTSPLATNVVSFSDQTDDTKSPQQDLKDLLEHNAQQIERASEDLSACADLLVDSRAQVQDKLRIWIASSAAIPAAMLTAWSGADVYALLLALLGLFLVLALGEVLFKRDAALDQTAVQARLSSAQQALRLCKQMEVAGEEKVAPSLATAAPCSAPPPLPEDITGYQLNVFANLPTEVLDFKRDVYSQLTPVQQRAFDKLNAMNTTRADEFTQLRWLQADKYDADKALARLKSTCEWRAKRLDAFLENIDWRLLRRAQALRPRAYCGLDKKGRPLCAEKLGVFFSSDEAHRGLPMEQWFLAYSFEMCEINNIFRQSVLKGNPYAHRLAYIGDLAGLSWTCVRVVPLLKSLVKEVETHFPEMAGPVTLINVPSFVTRIWAIVKKFLDPATVEKISFYSTPAQYGPALCELYGEDCVPVEYGGKNPVKVPGAAKNVFSKEFDQNFPPPPPTL